VTEVREPRPEARFRDGCTITQHAERFTVTHFQEVLMRSKSRQLAKDPRELEWAHSHTTGQSQQEMLIRESLG